MKIFQYREINLAQDFAMEGNQALHLMPGDCSNFRKDTPRCFKGHAVLAHLFDQDEKRLIETARGLGVRVIKVERRGARGQHIDLCGKPLQRALEEAGR